LTDVYANHSAAVRFGEVARSHADTAANIQDACIGVYAAQLSHLLRGLETPRMLGEAYLCLKVESTCLLLHHAVTSNCSLQPPREIPDSISSFGSFDCPDVADMTFYTGFWNLAILSIPTTCSQPFHHHHKMWVRSSDFSRCFPPAND
jgi:hypothetical protein